MTKITKFYFFLYTILAVAVVAVVVFLVYLVKSTDITLEKDQSIENTPVSVERLRQIGEWEFLTVSDEEIVDTVRRHLFSKDELVRIYYGELRLGIDMSEIADDAIRMDWDSVVIRLPKVRLLDEDFIDEARTRSFYESGTWDGKALEALYAKARQQMKERCLTRENYAAAESNARAQVRKMMSALGVENVRVE